MKTPMKNTRVVNTVVAAALLIAAAAAAKLSAIADIDAGKRALQQQFAYAIYLPKTPLATQPVDWRKFA